MKLRHLGALGVAITLVALTPTAANAASRWFQDPHGDVASSVDIHQVRVINGTAKAAAVRVTVEQRQLRAGDAFDIWIDTNAANPGPEYRTTWVANSDVLGVRKVDSFGDKGKAVSCPAFRVRSAQDDPGERSHVLLPRPCLGNPDAVRVSVRAQRQVGQEFVSDWAPRVVHFYDWVARN
jgi:hypothetical protein